MPDTQANLCRDCIARFSSKVFSSKDHTLFPDSRFENDSEYAEKFELEDDLALFSLRGEQLVSSSYRADLKHGR